MADVGDLESPERKLVRVRMPPLALEVYSAPMRMLLLGGLLLFTGCYQASFGPCAVTCGEGNACPADTTCGGDGYCHAPGTPATCPDGIASIDAGGDIVDGPLA